MDTMMERLSANALKTATLLSELKVSVDSMNRKHVERASLFAQLIKREKIDHSKISSTARPLANVDQRLKVDNLEVQVQEFKGKEMQKNEIQFDYWHNQNVLFADFKKSIDPIFGFGESSAVWHETQPPGNLEASYHDFVVAELSPEVDTYTAMYMRKHVELTWRIPWDFDRIISRYFIQKSCSTCENWKKIPCANSNSYTCPNIESHSRFLFISFDVVDLGENRMKLEENARSSFILKQLIKKCVLHTWFWFPGSKNSVASEGHHLFSSIESIEAEVSKLLFMWAIDYKASLLKLSQSIQYVLYFHVLKINVAQGENVVWDPGGKFSFNFVKIVIATKSRSSFLMLVCTATSMFSSWLIIYDSLDILVMNLNYFLEVYGFVVRAWKWLAVSCFRIWDPGGTVMHFRKP